MFINDLLQERSILRDIQKHHQKKLYAPDNPSGILLFQKKGAGYRLVKRDLENGKPVMTRIPKNEEAIASALALNLYRLVCIQYLQEKIDCVENVIKCHRSKVHKEIRKSSGEEVVQKAFLTEVPLHKLLHNVRCCPHEPSDFFQLQSPYRPFIVSHLQNEYKELLDWYLGDFVQYSEHPEYRVHPVKLKFKVRSKSEALAADRLFEEGILFHYDEQAFPNAGAYWDFLILITRHESYGWEHFGAMDKDSYCVRSRAKILTYLENNYYPGINMITTYETKSAPLSEEQVDQKIRWIKNRYRLAFPDMPPDESFNMYDLADHVMQQRERGSE